MPEAFQTASMGTYQPSPAISRNGGFFPKAGVARSVGALVPYKGASVTGFPESIPAELHPSPVTCFCPQSAHEPLLYGVGEDRPANLVTRSHRGAAPAFAA